MRGCLRVTGALIIDEAVVKSFERLTRCKLQYSVIPSYSRPDESLNLSIAYGYIQTMNHDSPLVIKRIVGWRVMIDWRRAGLDLQSHAHSRADDSPGLTARHLSRSSKSQDLVAFPDPAICCKRIGGREAASV
jgi:hypothetical protein